MGIFRVVLGFAALALADRGIAASFSDQKIDVGTLADVLNCDPSEVDEILDTIDPK